MPGWLRASVAVVWLGPARLAAACPDCPPIRAARAAIHDDPAFWTYVLLTALPFVLVVGIAGAAHRMGKRPKPSRREVRGS